jgi:hypothetical protein
MEYAAHLPSTRSLLVPVVALTIGAAGAVGVYAALDDAEIGVQSPRVIVTQAPAQPGEGVAAKHEAATAAAISTGASTNSFGKDEAATASAISTGGSTSSFGKDEAATAAAIGGSPLTSFGKDEAATASAVGSGSSSASTSDLSSDPLGAQIGRRR